MAIKYRKYLYLIVGLVIAGGLTFFVLQKKSSVPGSSQQVQSQRVCNDALIGRASVSVRRNDTTALREMTNEIVKLTAYRKDQNCLYILARYYMLIGDVKSGYEVLADLKKVYKKDGYSLAFESATFTPEEIERTFASIEQKNKTDAVQQSRNQKNMQATDQAADDVLNGKGQ